MTKEEKDEQCKIHCAKYTTPGMHSLFCPYTLDRWKRGEMVAVSGGKMQPAIIYK